METTEKIVESYCRYVEQWFTIPNIRCKGQYKIDLLAVDTRRADLRRYTPVGAVPPIQSATARDRRRPDQYWKYAEIGWPQ